MKTRLIILIIAILIIVGCNGGTGKEAPITDINVYQGTDGITMEFIKNMPPDKLLENEEFSIGLLIKNKGAFDVNVPEEGKSLSDEDKLKSGLIAVTVEEDYMGEIDFSSDTILDPRNSNIQMQNQNKGMQFIELRGKSRFNVDGEQTIKRFDTVTKLIDPRSEVHTSDIFVTACYVYQTSAVADVCVDTDIYGTRPGEKACAMATKSMLSQGAPVAVTKVEPGII